MTLKLEERVKKINEEGKLRRLAYKFFNNKEDVDDLVQDTLYKVFRHKDKYREDSNLEAWVYTIMRNTFITKKRKGDRSPFLDISEQFYFNLSKDNSLNKPDQEYGHKEINEKVDSLKDSLKYPLKMFLEGYKYKEIADRFEIPIGTVKSRINKAKKELQKELTN